MASFSVETPGSHANPVKSEGVSVTKRLQQELMQLMMNGEEVRRYAVCVCVRMCMCVRVRYELEELRRY